MLQAIRRIYGTPSIDIQVDDNAPWSRYTVTDKKAALSLYAKLGSFPEVEKRLWALVAVLSGYGMTDIMLKTFCKNVDDLYVSRVPNTRGANEINATDRQKQLLDFVKDKALVTNELVHLLNVTAATVRTDIKALLAKGKIKDISQNPRAKLVIAI